MKTVLVLFFVAVMLDSGFAMTREELKKTMTTLKHKCLEKNPVPESKIANIEKGEFIEEPDVKCFVACIYENMQVTRDGMVIKELALKQVDALYPPEIQERSKAVVEKCVDVQDKYTEFCDRVFYSSKCLYDTDPITFIFP